MIESLAAVFLEEAAAGADHDQRRRDLEGLPRTEVLPIPRIGQETFGVTYGQEALPRAVRSFVLAWRLGNVTASLTVQGFEGKVRLEDAVELARRQHRHLEEAA